MKHDTKREIRTLENVRNNVEALDEERKREGTSAGRIAENTQEIVYLLKKVRAEEHKIESIISGSMSESDLDFTAHELKR